MFSQILGKTFQSLKRFAHKDKPFPSTLLLKGEKKAPFLLATYSAFFFPLYPLSAITSPKNLNGLRSFLRNGLSFLLELEILKFAISKLQRLIAICILSQSFFRIFVLVLMQNQMLLPTNLITEAS